MVQRFALGLSVVVFALLACKLATADDLFEPPVRLTADGKVIDTGAAWGHSSPCIEDIDGDGLRDLIVGDFRGKFRIYKNVGQPNSPVYKDTGNIQAGGTEASVRIYCCVGAQPRFVDLNGDGIRDFISNSYDPGTCFLFRGLADHKFAASEELMDKAGVPVRSAPVQKQTYQSFGSFFTPVDWDADGDMDLLIGGFDGRLLLRVNEGDSKSAKFAADNVTINAGDQPLKVEAHCCPVVADWDSDGLWDVLAGSDDGSVTWFRNAGSKQSPRLESGVTLVQKPDNHGYDLMRWSEDEVVPGIRSQIEVVDHNGDSKLDLLVGDFCTAYEPKPDLDDQGKKQLRELIADMSSRTIPVAEKMKSLRADFAKRYPGDAVFSDEADKEWQKAYTALKEGPEFKAMESGEAELVPKIRLYLAGKRDSNASRAFDLAKSHGYVWLYIRK